MEKKVYWIVVLFTSDLLKIKLFPIQKKCERDRVQEVPTENDTVPGYRTYYLMF
jgi:hypothetical protein